MKRWETTKTINPPPRPGSKPKLDERARRRLHHINEQNPHAPLCDITADLNLNVSERTVGETLRQMNFYVHVARKKPFLNHERKQERLRWARERRNWNNFVWRKKIFVDEMKLTIGQGGGRSLVRRPPGTALENRYLEPAFSDEKTTVVFAAGFTYGFHTQLIPIRQRTERERESAKDRLGMNSVQYCQEIYTPHFLPLYELLGGADNDIEMVEDNSRVHNSHYSRRYRVLQGVISMPWASWSPDMNPIENVWSFFERRFREACKTARRRPYNRDDIIALAQEVWENMPWRRVYRFIDSMPRRITTLIRRHGGHTKW